MKISQNGINLIKEFEGCILTAYRCPAGIWTIGWGHTAGVKEGMKISQIEADAMLLADMVQYEGYVNKFVTVPITQGMFDALTSFTYNCGGGSLQRSTLLKLLNKKDYIGAYNEFAKWDKDARGNRLAGLTRRRKREMELFISDIAKLGNMTATQSEKPIQSKKTVDELAQEVRKGLWGNGQDRKNRLTKAGYSYTEVQRAVNKLYAKK